MPPKRLYQLAPLNLGSMTMNFEMLLKVLYNFLHTLVNWYDRLSRFTSHIVFAEKQLFLYSLEKIITCIVYISWKIIYIFNNTVTLKCPD